MSDFLRVVLVGLGSILAIAVVVIAIVFLIVPTFKGIGWLFKQVFTFIGGILTDSLRSVGTLLMVLILTPLAIGSIIIGRWSATAHYGRAIQNEFKTLTKCVYRIGIGHPARLLCLSPLLDGVEKRLPEVVAAAPGRDKPRGKSGQFDGYRIVGSLPVGGSGSKLYIAEPEEVKAATFERAGQRGVGKVVIKCFSIHDGSSLPQIVRESRSLDAAKKLGLVLDHALTPDRFFYVMRYVPGESLTTVTQQLHAESGTNGLDDRRLKQSLGFLADLVRTLDGYHQGGLWHKDVKPDNIIVDGQQAHLVDFGLLSSLRSAMTLTTHGTEYFRDPEMVRMALKGVKVHQVDGAKFDVFAAGAVMFSVVENSFPAHGALSQISKRCPDAVRWIVRRAMTDYDKRYASAAELLRDIEFVRGAVDPFAVKPAELPSMRGGSVVDFGHDVPPIPPRAAPNTPAGREPFDAVWSRILAFAGQEFRTTRNLPFIYAVDGNIVRADRANQNLPKSEFEKAYALYPITGSGQIGNVVRGSAYVWAILHDPRVAHASAWAGNGNGAASPGESPNPQVFAAPTGPRKRPRIKVTNWWTGKHEVEPGVPASVARAGSPVPSPLQPVYAAAVNPGVAPAGYNVPIGGIGHVDGSTFVASSYRGPNPSQGRAPRARLIVPPGVRRPAKEQLERARSRAKAAQDRAHARMAGRLSARRKGSGSNPSGMNAGVAFAAGLAVLVGVGVIIGAIKDSKTPRIHVENQAEARAAIDEITSGVKDGIHGAADGLRDGAEGMSSAVRDTVGEIMENLGGGKPSHDSARRGEPAIDAPARLLAAVGAAPQTHSGNVLFVSDVVVIGSQPYVRRYINQMEVSSEALRRMGFSVIGDAAHSGTLGSEEFTRQVELISLARRSVGTTPKGTDRMVDAVMGFTEANPDVAGVVWIWPDSPNNPTQFHVAVIGPDGAEVHDTDAEHFDQALVTAVMGAFTKRD